MKDFFKIRNPLVEEHGAGEQGTPSLVAKYKNATPEQQEAIAITMKKDGKKPKDMEEMTGDDKSSVALQAMVARKKLQQTAGKNKSQSFIDKMTSKANAGDRLPKKHEPVKEATDAEKAAFIAAANKKASLEYWKRHAELQKNDPRVNKTPKKESVEEASLDEISKATLGSYIKKASRDAVVTRKIGGDFENMADKSRKPSSKAASTALADKWKSKSWKRSANINKAVDRLTKEEAGESEDHE